MTEDHTCSCINPREDRKYAILNAAYAGHIDCVRRYITEGCALEVDEVEWPYDRKSALCMAAISGHHHIVQLLLESGSDVTFTDATQMTALGIAAFHGQAECVRALLQYDRDVDHEDLYGETALLHSACLGYQDCVSALIDSDALLNVTDIDGMTPLIWATQNSKPNIVKLLLEAGCDAEHRESRDGCSAFLLAAKKGDPECIKLLLKHGCNVSVRNRKKQTALHLASLNDTAFLVEELITNHNLNIEDRDSDGWTPLLHACWNGGLNCVNVLLQHGSSVNDNLNEDGYSQLLACIYNACNNPGSKQIIQRLLLADADIHVRDTLGHNALTAALQCSEVDNELVMTMYAAGAAVDKEVKKEVAILCKEIAQDQQPLLPLTATCRKYIRGYLLSCKVDKFKNLFLCISKLSIPPKTKDFLLYRDTDGPPSVPLQAWN